MKRSDPSPASDDPSAPPDSAGSGGLSSSGSTPQAEEAPRFLVDAMLGRLARWLRALGYDTVYDKALDDDDLARLAQTEDRLLLTRDRALCEERGAPDWCVLLAAVRPREQVRELDQRLGLFVPAWRDRVFTRCMVCNAPLSHADFPEVQNSIPAKVRSDARVRSAGFRRCSACERVYWEGSHTRRMRRWLETVARS